MVCALYACLAAVMTWPLVAHLGSAVLGPPGDNLEYVWKLWWFKRALVDLRVSPFFAPEVFYPFGYAVALSETTLAHTLLGLPLTWLCGEVAAYNLLMLFSFVLSGYGVFLLARELGASRPAAIVGGIAFSFCPYRMAHLGAGHLPLMGTGWIALLFWAIERFVRRSSWRWAALTGVFGVLVALSSWYYAFMVGLVAGVYLLVRLRPWQRAFWRLAALGKLLLAAGMVALLVAPAVLPMLRLYAEGEARYRPSLAYVDRWSASPMDFVYPNAMHPWWGEALTEAYYQNIHENLLYLGFVALILAGMGFWLRRAKPEARIWGALALATCVLALGTTLHFAGKPVYLSVSAPLEEAFSRGMHVLTGRLALNKVQYAAMRQANAIPIPLPSLLLYLYLPFMESMRVWARFGILTMLAVAVLAAWGLDEVLRRLAPRGVRRWGVVAAIALLMLLDLAALPYPYGYTEARAQPVDQWLASQAESGAIVQYPLDKTWNGRALYATRHHGRAVAYGYGTFTPQAYARLRQALAAWPSESTLALLRAWDIRYVLVGARSYGDAWPAVHEATRAMAGVEQVAVFEEQTVFYGDRLLRLVRPTDDVPVTARIGDVLLADLRDEIHVYTIHPVESRPLGQTLEAVKD